MKKVSFLLILVVGAMFNLKAQNQMMEKSSEQSFREYEAIEQALHSYIQSAKQAMPVVMQKTGMNIPE